MINMIEKNNKNQRTARMQIQLSQVLVTETTFLMLLKSNYYMYRNYFIDKKKHNYNIKFDKNFKLHAYNRHNKEKERLIVSAK